MIRHPAITGVVLAGGLATRMGGANKALIPSGRHNAARPILEHLLATFTGRLAGCVLVIAPSADPEAYLGLPVTIATDRREGCGPMGGIDAGLRAVRTSWAFVCACDMPRISGDLIDFMAGRALDGRALVPVRGGRPEPLHALYPAACAPVAEASLDEGIRTLRDLLARLSVDYLDERAFEHVPGASRSFDNLNTQEDLERFWREGPEASV